MAIFDVPAAELIEAIASDLKKQVKQPAWAEFVKTGSHRERAPHRWDWFYVRMASILYRVYTDGPVGTNRLRTYYGGRKARGPKPHRFRRASGKVIRLCLQELDKLGYLKKEKKGRVISGKGESYLNAKSKEIKKLVMEKKVQQTAAVIKPKEDLAEKRHETEKGPQAAVIKPKGHLGEKRQYGEEKEAEKSEIKGKEVAEKAAGEKK